MIGNNSKPRSGNKPRAAAKPPVAKKETVSLAEPSQVHEPETPHEVDTELKGTNRARAAVGRAPVRVADLRERPKIDMNFEDSEEGTGQLYIPPELIPHGFEVEWKRTSTYGKPEEASYMLRLEKNGWVPAHIEDFRTMMPDGYTGSTIERAGCILMIRPREYSQRSRQHNAKLAKGQLDEKLKQIGEAGSGEFKREVSAFSRSHGPAEVD